MSALEHLAFSLFGAKHSERLAFIMSHCFTCHWDESGTDPGTGGKSKADKPIILVGGYCSHVQDWVALEKRWRKIVNDDYGLPFFHMVDFANGNRPFNSWRDDDCDSLISSLLDVIADLIRMRLSWAIRIDDYREIVKADNIGNEDIVRAYHICARKCIEFISDLARVAQHQPKILHIFDRGNSAWPSFEAKFTQPMLDRMNILQPIPQSKIDVVSLQASDILAHQCARQILIECGEAKLPKRLYVNRLFNKPGFSFCASKNEVRRWYQEELYLEAHRTRGTYPSRITKGDMRQFTHLLRDMFAEPSEHHITAAIREL